MKLLFDENLSRKLVVSLAELYPDSAHVVEFGLLESLEEHRTRFISVTQGLDTDLQNPASRFLLHVLGAAAEFERSLIRERAQAGRLRYQQDFASGKVGKTVYSRSSRNLPPHRPRKIFNRDQVIEFKPQGLSIRQIARNLGLGVGTVVRTLLECFKRL